MRQRGLVTPSEIAEAAIKTMLKTMAVGEPLPSHDDLARELEVGRTSVRKAILRLAAAGLVQSRPGWAVVKADPGRAPFRGAERAGATGQRRGKRRQAAH